jgi:hypothetical protein
MRTPNILGICAALSIGLFAQEPPAHAERPMPPRPEQFRGHSRPYDKSREETISAKVVDVREVSRGPMVVVVLAVDVEGRDAEIPLGTKEYLKEQGVAFSKGDAITIKGVKNAAPRRFGPDGPRDREAYAYRGPVETAKMPKGGDPLDRKGRKEPKAADPANAPKEKETDAGETQLPLRIRARELTKGAKTLTLLNDDGRPVWRPRPMGAAGGPAGPERPGKPEAPERR